MSVAFLQVGWSWGGFGKLFTAIGVQIALKTNIRVFAKGIGSGIHLLASLVAGDPIGFWDGVTWFWSGSEAFRGGSGVVALGF